jgi:hypothetical protein
MRTVELKGFYLIETCGACPEQYEVFDKRKGTRVAYFRLRHGEFYAALTGPPEGPQHPSIDFEILDHFYEAEPNGDGRFFDDERDKYLTEACRLLREIIDPPSVPPCLRG